MYRGWLKTYFRYIVFSKSKGEIFWLFTLFLTETAIPRVLGLMAAGHSGTTDTAILHLVVNSYNISKKGKPSKYVANHLVYLAFFYAHSTTSIQVGFQSRAIQHLHCPGSVGLAGTTVSASTTKQSWMYTYWQMLEILRCNLSPVDVSPIGQSSFKKLRQSTTGF